MRSAAGLVVLALAVARVSTTAASSTEPTVDTRPSPSRGRAPGSASTSEARPLALMSPLPEKPRITSIGVFTNIYAVPSLRGAHLGYVHFGESVALRQSEPIRRDGCPAGWLAIAPRGFVCNDATLVVEVEGRKVAPHVAKLMAALDEARPTAGGLPFKYALSLGTAAYGRIPTEHERDRYERRLHAPTHPIGDRPAHGAAATLPASPSGEPPWFISEAELSPDYVGGREPRFLRKSVPRGSFVSYQSRFEWGGRTWLVTPELSVVAADRVHELQPSTFRGLELDDTWRLPLAWIRKEPRPKYRLAASDEPVASGELWPVRTAVGLTGARLEAGNQVFLQTTEPGVYISEADATVVSRSERLPRDVRPTDKWIQISVGAGTLTAYQGREPVFATLISPGRGGAPAIDRAPNRALALRAQSPLGTYRILYKERYSVMSPDRSQKTFFIADVPHIQYFRGPYALHAAYWHEDFGEPKSGGCINLAPEDAARLFAWTDPPLPTGWHSAQSSKANGVGTRVQITR